ncbi:lantibiotic dehydratase [Streptomyces sp. NPDC090306]|uniref:lantibiotic dehydratase n=1 Tax=Streptomyces sp. NPDC090306 TaxID=3365961 RepID=UPI00381B125D
MSPDRGVRFWPDLTGEAGGPASWRPWLETVWQIPGFAAAVEQASPTLAHRVQQVYEGRQLAEPALRKVVVSLMRYALRAGSRATPFGLFAGVASARVGAASAVRLGDGHQAVARPDANWLAAVVEELEADRVVQDHLTVQANRLAVERDGQVEWEHRPAGNGGSAPARVHVRLTEPVKAALEGARAPIRTADLTSKLAADFPQVPVPVVRRLLASLIAQRLLVTDLRPPMSATDPLAHILNVLGTGHTNAPAATVGPVAKLNDISRTLRQHNTLTIDSATARTARAEAGTAMRELSPVDGSALSVDLRLDAEVTLSAEVAAEAARAATVLVGLSGRAALSRAWVAWHGRFLERYGPRAVVPLLEAVNGDSGLGYPAGFLGGPPVPQPAPLSERDVKLLTLAQQAALRHHREVVLDEAGVADLAVDTGPEISVQPTTEMTVRVGARSVRALDAGEFTLAVVGVSRAAGTTTGRFLSLLTADDRKRMTAAYAAATTAVESALTVQAYAPPLYLSTEDVARTPPVTNAVIRLGECHETDGPEQVSVEDIAVTADVHRLYLISIARRRPLQFVTMNAVEPTRRIDPLVRFLTEATHALSVPCTAFDWGAAAGLPYLPALRYGRTVLSPARWRLTASDLADVSAGWEEWDRSLSSWRELVAAPRTVFLGDGDQRLRLDLADSSHRALLRAQVRRDGSAVLRADSAADAGWLDGRPHEVVIPLSTANSPVPAPRWLQALSETRTEPGRLPGCGGRFLVKLYARRDRHTSILTSHLPHLLAALDDEAKWWFLPYRDPDEHLRLRLIVSANKAADSAAAIGVWTERLRQADLLARVQWDTDFPETARFGGPQAEESAEAFFAADSMSAVAQRAACAAKDGPDQRSLTAASMLDLAIGLIGDPIDAMRWLVEHARTAGAAPARDLYDQAVALANPYDRSALAAQPEGEEVLACWRRRRQAATAYRTALAASNGGTAGVLLPELLHLHHTRMVGLDAEAERRCVHLARAAALSWTARATKGMS